MATVYGYFRSDEDARKAAVRCEQMGVTPSIVEQEDQPIYVDEPMSVHTMIRRERTVLNAGLVGAILMGIFGGIVWTVIPALHDKLNIAGPLMMALYGAGIGIIVGMFLHSRRHYADEVIPEEIGVHPAAARVLVVQTTGLESAHEVEELLESEGAIEVIHRAA